MSKSTVHTCVCGIVSLVLLAGIARLDAAEPAAPATAPSVPATPPLATDDFENGTSFNAAMQVVDVSSVTPPGKGSKTGKLGPGFAIRGGFALPTGAKLLQIQYDRLFTENPDGKCSAHFVRQYVRFNNKGEERFGQANRSYLRAVDANRWLRVTVKIPVPEGATSVTLMELANVVEGAKGGYAGPIYIDNLQITAD